MVCILSFKITTKRRYIQDIGLICWQTMQIITPIVFPFSKIFFLFSLIFFPLL